MQFDTNKYKVWTWKHPLMLHWMLNPGLAFNELVLGQSVPKITLIEKSGKPLAEKAFVPCPHCGTIHSGLKWSFQNKTAFGNWFGLYCDHCGKTIPPLRNLTSLVLLALTLPVWIWFWKRWKRRWLANQKERFSKPFNLERTEFNWVAAGLAWGAFMFLVTDLILPLFDGEGFKLRSVLIGAVIWMLAGLLFGFVVKKMIYKPSAANSRKPTEQAG